jgi:DNA-binding Xre family transcriptional regulator
MTKTAQLRVSLDRILSARNITTYRLMKQLEGRVSRGTVYSLASGNVQRIDLETLAGIMAGLEELTGETITPNDLLEVVEAPNPDEDLAWIDSSAADLAAHLADLEKDVPPEELNAWHEAFEQQATPIVFDSKRRVWLSGDAARIYKATAR